MLDEFMGERVPVRVDVVKTVGLILCDGAAVNKPTADEGDFDSVTAGFDLVAPVSVTDRQGPEIVGADTTTWVTPTHQNHG